MTRFLRALTFAIMATGMVSTATAALAPPVDFSLLLSDQECVDVLPLDGVLYGALSTGGVAVWDEADPSTFTRWTTLDGLTSNRINDLHWTGDHLWVATQGGGLTRVTLDETGPLFRQYTGLGDVSALNVAVVTGRVVDGSERVFYGLVNGGVGIINDGFAGNIFSAASFDGLVSDMIHDLAFVGDDLWIATADGISVYREGVFLARSDGLGNRHVSALLARAGGELMAATDDGVYRWSAAGTVWEAMGSSTAPVADLVEFEGQVWSLTAGDGTADRLRRWDGSDWVTEDVPEGRVSTLAATTHIWTAGQIRPVDGNDEANTALLARRLAADDWSTWTWDDLLFNEVDGVEITPDGTVWLGSRVAAGWAGWDGSSWDQYPELASADNDSLGLINFGSNLLNIESASDGTLWITQFFRGGIIRFRPWLNDVDIIEPDTSPLSNGRIVRILALDGGAVLFLSDNSGVDLLLDPDAWADPDSWRTLPSDATGLGGLIVRDAVQTRADRVWFTTDDGGLVLWDTNGAAGATEPTTLGDFSDDVWPPPISSLPGTSYGFLGTKGLVEGPDGSLWAGGGSGVIRLRLINYDDEAIHMEVLGTWREKAAPDLPGLLRGSVNDIEVDANGHIWVCHEAGLDRIRVSGESVEIDGYTNANAYESFGLNTVVGASTIRGLAEGPVRELDTSDDGRTLVAGGGYGAIVVEVGNAQSGETGPLENLTVYPNPFIPAQHPEGLFVGGFDSDVVFGTLGVEGGAWIEIFDLEGKRVHRDRNVEQDTSFWDGLNFEDVPVASGTYLLKASLDGQIIVKPLAVVR